MVSGAGSTATRVIVVSDIVASTRWRVEHGDDAGDELLAAVSRMTHDAAERAGGRVVEDRGDGFLCSFESAVAALEAAQQIREGAAGIVVGGVTAPEVRIGVAAGDVVEHGREMYGLPVVTAARLEAAATPGEILCTDVVRALAGTRASNEFTAARTLDLAGLPHEVDVWTVSSTSARASSPPVPAASSLTGSLPTPVSTFFGRLRERRDLDELVSSRPLVTITGPGGVGKTRVALELATSMRSRYPDGVWFVALESATNAADVVAGVVRTLRLPPGLGERGAEALGKALESSRTLLVLDNCEQATPAVAEVARTLVESAPELRLLATSRQPLGLLGEVVWALEPLPAPDVDLSADELATVDSMALLVDRAHQLDAGRELGPDELSALAEVVRRVDGLPLAIELAAARLRVLSPAELLDHSDDLVVQLSGPEWDRPDRHRTIQAAVEWSLASLTSMERYALAGAAVFAGGAPTEAMAEVCPEAGEQLVDLLAALVDKSLLRRDDSGRFVMLVPIREVVVRRPEMQSRVADARALHLAFYAGMARRLGPVLQAQPVWLRRFAAEEQNFSTALETALRQGKSAALSLAGDLGIYWVLAGRAVEGDRRFSEILARPGDVEPTLLAAALRTAAMAAALGSRYARSEQLLLAARALYAELDRPQSIAYCDIWLARNAVVQCHFGLLEPAALDRAYDRLERAIKTLDAADEPMGALLAYPYLGWARLLQGDLAAAARLTDDLENRCREPSTDLFAAYAVAHCAFVRSALGELDTAELELDHALGRLHQSGDTQNLLITSCVEVALRHRRGEAEQARAAAQRIVACAEDCASSEWESLALASAAHVVAAGGDWSTAGGVVAFLEREFPTWRAALANTGIEPGVVLEHARATVPVSGAPTTYREALGQLGRALG